MESVVAAASARMQEDRDLYQLSKVTPPELVPWDMVWRKSGIRDADKIADGIAQKLGITQQAQESIGALAGGQSELPEEVIQPIPGE